MSDFFHVAAFKRHRDTPIKPSLPKVDSGLDKKLTDGRSRAKVGKSRCAGYKPAKKRQSTILPPCPKSLSLLEFAALF
jgi:hypothetical protein